MKLFLFRFFACVLGALFLFTFRAEAQNPPPSPRLSSPGEEAPPEAPYLLPQTIFVGDSGRLVVPLGQAFAGAEPFVLESPANLPESPEIVIKRLELEQRGGLPRLLIDFVPYAPGLLDFPPLEFPSRGTAPLIVTGLKARVASILEPSQTTLAEPVPPMAVPGTSFLVYGTTALVLAFLFLGIGGSIWSRRHFGELWERLRRRHLLRAMARFLRRVEHEKNLEREGAGYYLTLLSGELREFLSLFTGINCRSLTAGEFLELPLEQYWRIPAVSAESASRAPDEPDGKLLSPAFLRGLFRTWDTLRFSGRNIDKIDLFLALKETKNFIAALEKAERERALTTRRRDTAGEKKEPGPSVNRAAAEGDYGL